MKLVDRPKAKVVLYYPIVWMPQWPMWSPLCMYALATALMHEGYEVVLIDERVDEDPRGWLEKELESALFVGIPGKFGGQCRNMEAAARFIKSRRPRTPVVAGGWFPSLFPEATLTSPNIDIVTIGPADHSLPQVADRLLEGRSPAGIDGVYFKRDGVIEKNRTTHLPPIERTHPIPWEVVNIGRYLHPHGWINYFTSRGCTGGCTFCSIFCLDPHRWTGLPPDRVIADLEVLYHRIGARAFQIMDTNFCADPRRVDRICELILERGLDIRFHVLGRYKALSRMTDAQIRLLRRAGCGEIEVGLESGSQQIADSIDKQVEVDAFPSVMSRFVRAGIRIRVNIMLGLPGERRAEMARSFRRMLELKALGGGIVFQLFRFTPLPDSNMGRRVFEVKSRSNPGRVPQTYEELLQFKVNDEDVEMFWISERQERLLNRAYRFYAPLLFYEGALDTAKGRPWWRAGLALSKPLARWRLKHGFFLFPFEKGMNHLLGRPMPRGGTLAVPPPEYQLPMPEAAAEDAKAPGTQPREMGQGLSLDGPPPREAALEGERKECAEPSSLRAALAALPQPMHLYEFLTRSGHYHFGFFESKAASLPAALDRMVLQSAAHLAPCARVLDVGCGMGGGSLLLARQGHTVLGIEPDEAAVAYALSKQDGTPSLTFRNCGFRELASSRESLEEAPRFDGIMMIETLQYFPRLDEVFHLAGGLLAPGGLLLIHDVMTTRPFRWSMVPFHRDNALASAAGEAGWREVYCADATSQVIPTLDRLARGLEEERSSLCSFFSGTRPCVEKEIDEVLRQWKHLETGFESGDLVYRIAVFQAPEREG